MKTHLQAIKIILCSLTLGVGLIAQAALPAPNDQMATIPSGLFIMGDANDTDNTDAPKHNVTVSTFQMDKNLITSNNWKLVYNYAISSGYIFAANAGVAFSGANQPVQSVSWYDAVKWCNARSQMEGLERCYYTDTANTGWKTPYTTGNINLTTNNVKWDANGYRLPTEAEWEKAARGGLTTNRFPWGMYITHNDACYVTASSTQPYDLGTKDTYPSSTVSVIKYNTNGFGLYGMAGNLSEWCGDVYSGTYYSTGSHNDPKGPSSGGNRVVRGGSWSYFADLCRCATRQSFSAVTANPSIGFRCVQGKQSQTMTFNPLPNHVYGDGSINLSLFAIGGGSTSPVIFTNTGPATISGISSNILTITGAGLVTVTANQAGDDTYSAASPVSQSFTVLRATPVILWGNPANINYGMPLSGAQLNASSGGVPGTFVYTPSINTVLNAGNGQTLSVQFTPTDTTDYNTPASKTVNINVQKATPVISWGNPANINYGTPLSGAQLNASSGGVPGTFVYTPSINTVLNAGNGQTLSVQFTPTDTTDYNTPAPNTVNINVQKVTPVISWGTPTDINYGVALSTNQLNATTSIPPDGTFDYTPALGTVLNAGTNTLMTVFTPVPSQKGDYNGATNNVSLVVSNAVLTVTANDASRNYGVTNPVFTASYSGFVNGETNIGPNSVLSGSPSLTTVATTTTIAGSNLITAAQGTLSATNYSFSFVNGTLTITNINGIVDPAALRAFIGNGIVDQAGLNVVLANYWASSPPHISDFDISAKTNFTFIITNFNFTMQFSTNLVNPNWQDLGQAVFQFTDTNAVNNQTGFYRLVAPTNQ